MKTIFSALFRALRDLFHPKVLLLTLLPLSIAFPVWAVFYYWAAFTPRSGSFINPARRLQF
jgi:hypothetical protein